MLGFAVVFRLSQAYARYWEGLGRARMMSSRWGDAALEVLSFDCHSKPGATPDGTPEEETLPGTRRLFYATVAHKFSLIHALACAHLRREVRLRDMEEAVLDRERRGFDAKRPIKTMARPIGGCMRNFLRALCPTTTSSDDYFIAKPLRVLGGVSDRERAQLERLDSETRVAATLAGLMGTINARRAAGGMWVDPPAVSRIHQVLSEGMLGFQEACKIEDTPLPFAYTQMVSFTLAIFAVTFPLIAASKASGYDPSQTLANDNSYRAFWLAPSLTFIAVMTYFLLHEVARELEDPFLHQPNEAPLVHAQMMFNQRLVSTWEALEELHDPSQGGVVCGLNAIDRARAKPLVDTWTRQQPTSRFANALEIASADDESTTMPLYHGRKKHSSTLDCCQHYKMAISAVA